MKKFQFLLLDAGPIIKLFQLGIWDELTKRCDITISRTVMEEAKWASRDFEDIKINLEPYEQMQKIQVIDLSPAQVKLFSDQFDNKYKADIHAGEKEILAFLNNSTKDWKLCSSDGAVYRVLGLLGKANQGISLEELLNQLGLSKKLERQYTKTFREYFTHLGQKDSIQGQGFAS